MSILRWGTSGGGHTGAFALIVKYPPKKAAKNIASEATNRTIPSTGPLISGRARLTDEDGHGETFGPGSAFVIPAGFKGSWETLETLKKYYAIFQPG